jgi:DNA polymerase-2
MNQAQLSATVSGDSSGFRAFLVHIYADLSGKGPRDRLFLTGRLEDGRSFAAAEDRWRPRFHVYESDRLRWAAVLSSVTYTIYPSRLEPFSGREKEKLVLLEFSRYGDRTAAAKLLERAGIPSPDMDLKVPDAFLLDCQIRGYIIIQGRSRPGRLVDLVFPEAEIRPVEDGEPPIRVALKIASIDIETDTRDNSIRAVSIALADSNFGGVTGLVRVLAPSGNSADSVSGINLFYHRDEESLLRSFIKDIQGMDPDILTGWNFLDFDFPRLSERCEYRKVPFAIGRSGSLAKFFAGEPGWGWRRRSAAALVPGRQVIDALRIVRSGPWRFPDYTLETVSQAVLGEGKTVIAAGKKKIAELNRLYAEDPRLFGEYCYQDAVLIPRILAKTGLFRLTLERASLTGVSLDKAWTSVVSFERVYGMELRRRGIAPPVFPEGLQVSGAAGGTVLDPVPGFFSNVGVFDFRSLYPTIIRTFNIDPWTYAQALAGREDEPAVPSAYIEAPNGARFSRESGILPSLIANYFAARRKALDNGDDNAAHVYKILMNSFYGVLGTASCRYARTELAGAITSFARKWLLCSRDWFSRQGYRVLYGDTDSLFVQTGLGDEASYQDFADRCGTLAAELNRALKERIQSEYQLESFIELRFEKAYRRFMIPPLRGLHDEAEIRGRAKGYGGYLLDSGGGASVEIKGMEAVRSDSTPLARRIQVELLELVFSGSGEEAFRERILEIFRELRQGKLDGELIYRKRLTRPPETYTSSTPPQVKAARALGWKGRRGTVEFVWTVEGPEPFADEDRQPLSHAPLDYDHYAESQVLPVVRSIADAAGWKTDFLPGKGRGRRFRQDLAEGQMELGL